MPVDIDIAVDPSDGVRALKQVADQQNRIANADKTSLVASERLLKVRQTISRVTTAGLVFLAGKVVADTLAHVKATEALARSLDVTRQKAQELALAEKEAGLSEGSIKDAIISIAEAQGRNADELKRLGFSYQEIRQASPVDLFEQLSEKLKQGEVSATEFADALTVTGENRDVVRALTGDFSDLQAQVRESGKIIEEEAFDKMIDGSRNLTEAIKDLASNVTENLVSAFEYFGNVAGGVFNQLAEGIDLIQGAIVFLTNLGGGLLGGMSFKEAEQFAIGEGREFLNKQRERRESRITNRDNRISETELSKREGEAAEIRSLAVQLGAKPQVDSLARVGLFAGRGQNEAVALQRKAAKLLVSIDRTAKQQNQTLEEKL